MAKTSTQKHDANAKVIAHCRTLPKVVPDKRFIKTKKERKKRTGDNSVKQGTLSAPILVLL